MNEREPFDKGFLASETVFSKCRELWNSANNSFFKESVEPRISLWVFVAVLWTLMNEYEPSNCCLFDVRNYFLGAIKNFILIELNRLIGYRIWVINDLLG